MVTEGWNLSLSGKSLHNNNQPTKASFTKKKKKKKRNQHLRISAGISMIPCYLARDHLEILSEAKFLKMGYLLERWVQYVDERLRT